MTKTHLEFGVLNFVLSMLVSVFLCVESHQGDASVMLTLKQRLNPPKELGWSDPDPCNWKNVRCSNEKRVTCIQIGRKNLSGILPSDLRNLTALERLDLHFNQISGPLPSLSGLSSLQFLRISHNQFTSIPADFFSGLSSLQSVEIDKNPFSAWEIQDSLRNASMLRNFSAITANITGKIPDFFGRDHFPALTNLHLSFNNLEGGLPPSFAESSIQSLWLNGLKGNNKLTGSIEVLQNMTSLKEVWLHSNAFSGQLPDLSGLKNLQNLNLRDNMFTGPVPATLVSLPALKILNLTNNLLQGPTPKFPNSVAVSMLAQSNSFCLPVPGDCDPRVSILLSIAKSVGYPIRFAENWKGNDPCTSWFGIICTNLNITTINFQKMGLTGTISPDFSLLVSLQKLVLANNNLTGSIPSELTTLPDLREIDVSNNHLYGEIPKFRTDVIVNTSGNPNIGKKGSPSPGTSGILSGSAPGIIGTSNVSNSGADKSSIGVGVVVGSVIGIISVIFLAGLLAFHIYKTKQKRFGREQNPNTMVIHPRHSGSDPGTVKIAVAGSRVSVGTTNETYRLVSSGLSDIQMVEAGSMVVSIQVLTSATNNFNEENILGRGGFGTVYKGELHDGSKIAVKRMESGMMSGKGVKEFESEIAVLTRVRHRHLVALLGYCLDGNERLLVYEYMAQGSLSRHLFRWKEEGLKPLEWSKRLSIALDVARGVEYLHGLAHQSFIHRDLKPSNILLGDDMSPKVADFGLVRPTSEGKDSIETRLAGTFGYLAPEYAVTGRVTTKVDVFSFGVTLMELITGRKALDESQSEDSMYLETWFRRIHINEDTFREAIDPTIELTEESLASISTVAKLAGHCCEWNPNQRPDMRHAVRVLSSLVEHWMPADHNFEDMYGIDLNMIHSGHFGGNSRASLNRTRRHRSLPSRTTPRPGYSPGLLHANMHSPRPVGVRGRKKNREKLVTWG